MSHAKTRKPKLRFQRFRDRSGWARTTLGSVLTDHGLTSDGKCEVYSVSLSNGIVPQIEHMGRSFAATDTGHYSLVRPFDIVYTRSPLAIFKLGIVKQHKRTTNAIVSPLYGVFTPKNKYLGRIIEAYFESPYRSLHYLDPLAQKGAKNTIQLSNERFLSGSLFLPDDENEQQKIAECLSSLDELIGAESQKLDALKARKKGLMQQLFPQEGKALPPLRFPSFREEWVETRLEELCKSISSGKDQNDPDGDFSLHGSTEIIGKTKFPSYNGEHILVARVGANAGLLTKVSGQFGVTDNTLVVSLSPNPLINIDYIFHYLGSLNVNRLIFGSGQPLITGSILKNLRIRLPTDSEQKKIASCLSSLDDLISAQSDKLDALKTHKKGLMQQLFPSAEVYA